MRPHRQMKLKMALHFAWISLKVTIHSIILIWIIRYKLFVLLKYVCFSSFFRHYLIEQESFACQHELLAFIDDYFIHKISTDQNLLLDIEIQTFFIIWMFFVSFFVLFERSFLITPCVKWSKEKIQSVLTKKSLIINLLWIVQCHTTLFFYKSIWLVYPKKYRNLKFYFIYLIMF